MVRALIEWLVILGLIANIALTCWVGYLSAERQHESAVWCTHQLRREFERYRMAASQENIVAKEVQAEIRCHGCERHCSGHHL